MCLEGYLVAKPPGDKSMVNKWLCYQYRALGISYGRMVVWRLLKKNIVQAMEIFDS